MLFESAKSFIYKNARPLDLARWKYLFENGDQEDVLTALAAYQNEDGGFGHALEPDCWNPNSSPVQTWAAAEIIKEIKLEDRRHPVIQGILKYLSSDKDFNGHIWDNTILSNNDYPHAEWWTCRPGEGASYNPTASLLGFILKFAETGDDFYQRTMLLVEEAFEYFKKEYPMESMHTVSCFAELYDYLKERPGRTPVDMDEFKELLHKQIHHVIDYDVSAWEAGYVCKPSLLIRDKSSDFYSENKKICQKEAEFIRNTQNPGGTWNITWNWDTYPEEWHISKNWWKSDVIIKNVRFVSEMEK